MSDTQSTPKTLTGELRALAAAVDAINSVPSTTLRRAALQIAHLEMESQERMVRIVTLERELAAAQERIKRLEGIGNRMEGWCNDPKSVDDWRTAMEDGR